MKFTLTILLTCLALSLLSNKYKIHCEEAHFHRDNKLNDTSKVVFVTENTPGINTISLQGTVVNRVTNKPIAEASVMVLESDLLHSDLTAKYGKFALVNLTKGRKYTIFCAAARYGCLTIDSIEFKDATHMFINIKLGPNQWLGKTESVVANVWRHLT